MRLVGQGYEWRGIGVAEEDKLGDGADTYDVSARDNHFLYRCQANHNSLQNRCKAVWSMHHIMRDDPTRRLTFAITVENSTMRIWFGSRSFLIVTEGFNWITDVEKLIRVYSSFAFATKSELGWDPTMRYIPNTKPAEYDIDVYPKADKDPVTYRNCKIIWDYGAESMYGRATRVFSSTHPETKEPVAIKDVWQDQDRVSEGANVDKIMERIAQRGEPFLSFKKYFMEVMHYGDVVINGQIDETLGLIMHNTPFPRNHTWLRLQKPIKAVDGTNGEPPMVDGLGATITTLTQNRQKDLRRCIHYHIVFAHIGTPVYELPALKDRCCVLIDSLKALDALYRLGWVHRDISVGNILCVKDSSNKITGKLSDLEYIMALDCDDPAHSVRTGTVDFMASEVDNMAYSF
ncbi:hypothetical protein PLICRDRAFT_113885, partial [Plicaturopsis crispa FD-325 SS-3]